MKTLPKKILLPILVLSGTIFISGSSFAAEDFSMEDKLKQCEMAFNNAHSGSMSQAEAAKSHRKHKDLMLEILENLNKRNTEISTKTGEAMSNKEIIDNFRVMGRLLEMIAGAHRPPQTEWDYAY